MFSTRSPTDKNQLQTDEFEGEADIRKALKDDFSSRLKIEVCRNIYDLNLCLQKIMLSYTYPHPRILAIKNFTFTKDKEGAFRLYIVTPRMKTSLTENIQAHFHNQEYYPQVVLVEYILAMVEILIFLNQKSIAHGNLKTSNIFLDQNDDIYLSEISHIYTYERRAYLSMPEENSIYLAPELKLKKIFDTTDIHMGDAWSVGIISLELAELQHMTYLDLEGEAFEARLNSINTRYGDYLPILIKNMLNIKPSKRWSLQEIRDFILETYIPGLGQTVKRVSHPINSLGPREIANQINQNKLLNNLDFSDIKELMMNHSTVEFDRNSMRNTTNNPEVFDANPVTGKNKPKSITKLEDSSPQRDSSSSKKKALESRPPFSISTKVKPEVYKGKPIPPVRRNSLRKNTESISKHDTYQKRNESPAKHNDSIQKLNETMNMNRVDSIMSTTQYESSPRKKEILGQLNNSTIIKQEREMTASQRKNPSPSYAIKYQPMDKKDTSPQTSPTRDDSKVNLEIVDDSSKVKIKSVLPKKPLSPKRPEYIAISYPSRTSIEAAQKAEGVNIIMRNNDEDNSLNSSMFKVPSKLDVTIRHRSNMNGSSEKLYESRKDNTYESPQKIVRSRRRSIEMSRREEKHNGPVLNLKNQNIILNSIMRIASPTPLPMNSSINRSIAHFDERGFDKNSSIEILKPEDPASPLHTIMMNSPFVHKQRTLKFYSNDNKSPKQTVLATLDIEKKLFGRLSPREIAQLVDPDQYMPKVLSSQPSKYRNGEQFESNANLLHSSPRHVEVQQHVDSSGLIKVFKTESSSEEEQESSASESTQKVQDYMKVAYSPQRTAEKVYDIRSREEEEVVMKLEDINRLLVNMMSKAEANQHQKDRKKNRGNFGGPVKPEDVVEIMKTIDAAEQITEMSQNTKRTIRNINTEVRYETYPAAEVEAMMDINNPSSKSSSDHGFEMPTKVLDNLEVYSPKDQKFNFSKKILTVSKEYLMDIKLAEWDESGMLAVNWGQVDPEKWLDCIYRWKDEVKTFELRDELPDDVLSGLRAIFSEMKSLEALSFDFKFSKLNEKTSEILRDMLIDFSRIKSMRLINCKIESPECATNLFDGLRHLMRLEQLTLVLQNSKFTSQNLATFGEILSEMKKLKRFTLNLIGSENLLDFEWLKTGLDELKYLESIQLILDSAKFAVDESSTNLKFCVSSKPMLNELVLSLCNCRSTNLEATIQGIATNENLEHLSLNYSRSGLEESGYFEIQNLINKLNSGLTSLNLNFMETLSFGNRALEILNESFSKLKTLKKLNLNFSKCLKLKDQGLQGLSQSLFGLSDLKELRVVLTGCGNLTDTGIDAFSKSLASMDLLKLILNFSGVSINDQGLKSLGKAIQKLINIKDLQIYLDDCKGLTDKGVLSLFTSLENVRTEYEFILGIEMNSGLSNQVLLGIMNKLNELKTMKSLNLQARQCHFSNELVHKFKNFKPKFTTVNLLV